MCSQTILWTISLSESKKKKRGGTKGERAHPGRKMNKNKIQTIEEFICRNMRTEFQETHTLSFGEEAKYITNILSRYIRHKDVLHLFPSVQTTFCFVLFDFSIRKRNTEIWQMCPIFHSFWHALNYCSVMEIYIALGWVWFEYALVDDSLTADGKMLNIPSWAMKGSKVTQDPSTVKVTCFVFEFYYSRDYRENHTEGS